jgi:hypothetical protein
MCVKVYVSYNSRSRWRSAIEEIETRALNELCELVCIRKFYTDESNLSFFLISYGLIHSLCESDKLLYKIGVAE